MSCRPLILATLSLAGAVLSSRNAGAQGIDARPQEVRPQEEGPQEEGPADLIAQWIAEAVPRQYERKEDWGRTRRVTVGVDASGRGLNVRLRKKTKDVPHGVWKHYRVTLPDAPDTPRVEIENLRVEGGRAAVTIHLSAPLVAWGRTRVYQHGVHLATLTADAQSTLYARLDCEIAVRLEPGGPLPTVILEPVVRHAEIKLLDFRLTRISQADGPLVKELGRAVEHLVEKEFEPHKLTEKLNRAVAKKSDRLRLSLAELVSSGWAGVASPSSAVVGGGE